MREELGLPTRNSVENFGLEVFKSKILVFVEEKGKTKMLCRGWDSAEMEDVLDGRRVSSSAILGETERGLGQVKLLP